MPALTAGGWSQRRALAASLGMVALGATLAATAGPAVAHATLLSTVPTGDESFTSSTDRLDEPVEMPAGAVRVTAISSTTTSLSFSASSGDAPSRTPGSAMHDPDDGGGSSIPSTLALGFLGAVVLAAAVGFARSSRRLGHDA